MKTFHHALIIDDDPDLCLLLKDILNDTIPVVKFAHSIESGEQLLNDLHPDIIFLDNNLPDGQGVNYIKEIKSISSNAFLVIITAADHSREQAISYGADVFIEKPLTPDNINAALTVSH